MRFMKLAPACAALAACTTPSATPEPVSIASVATVASVEAAPLAVSDADRLAIQKAISDVYAVISGPAGQARDWDAMRAMFTPHARLSAITPKGVASFTVDEYIEKSGPILIEHGFVESELAQRLEAYGRIAHAWSSYDGSSTDGKIKVRGINSFQLAKGVDDKWRVQSIYWQQEVPQYPLPKDMEK